MCCAGEFGHDVANRPKVAFVAVAVYDIYDMSYEGEFHAFHPARP